MKMKRKPVKASRRPMSASARSAKARNLCKVSASKRTGKRSIMANVFDYENVRFTDLTPEQKTQAIEEFLNSSFAGEWFSEDMMESWEALRDADVAEFTNKYGIEVNADKLYWNESSQGPYPEWKLGEVFDEYTDAFDDVEFYITFYGSLDVEFDNIVLNTYENGFEEYGDNIEALREDGYGKIADIAESKLKAAQQFIDTIWSTIRDISMSYPDEEWAEGILEANDYEFIVDSEDGSVVQMA